MTGISGERRHAITLEFAQSAMCTGSGSNCEARKKNDLHNRGKHNFGGEWGYTRGGRALKKEGRRRSTRRRSKKKEKKEKRKKNEKTIVKSHEMESFNLVLTRSSTRC